MISTIRSAINSDSNTSLYCLCRGAIEGLIIGICGSLLLFSALILAPNTEGLESIQWLWGDDYDARLINWILAWGYHALWELKDLKAFWQANSFYPYPNSLAFSDSLLGAQLFYTPLRILGFTALSAMYLTLSCTIILGCSMSAVALMRLKLFSFWERVFIVFAAQFSLPMVNFFGHHQLVGFSLAPSFLLFSFLYLRSFKTFDLCAALIGSAIALTFCAYLGPILLAVCILVFLPRVIALIAAQYQSSSLKQLLRDQQNQLKFATHIALAALTAFTLYYLQFSYYLENTALSSSSLSQSVLFSARPLSLLVDASGFSAWYAPHPSSGYQNAERAFFPGLLLFGCLIVFVTLLSARALSGMSSLDRAHKDTISQASENPRHLALRALVPQFALEIRSLLYFCSALLIVILILALGPWHPALPELKLPFFYLTDIVPGLDQVRAPGRFGMLLGLPLGILAVFCFRILFPSISSVWLLTLLIVDSVVRVPIYQYDPEGLFKDLYPKVAEYIKPNQALIELPLYADNPIKIVKRINNQLNGSLLHWANLVSGYGARSTAELDQLIILDRKLQSGKARPTELLDYADSLKIKQILINLNRYRRESRYRLRKVFEDSRRIEVVFDQEGWILLRLQDTARQYSKLHISGEGS